MEQQTLEFKAEVKELLNIVINALYSQKDIFLRELISNASDAIDRLKLHTLLNESGRSLETDFQIKIIPDKEKKTLTVKDNGIGMTRSEIIETLGTLARSGTKEFLEYLKTRDIKENPNLIGQFGVGFYSAFIVATKVEVISKSSIEESSPVKWISDGSGSFTVEDSVKEDGAGTNIIVYLKDEDKKYLEEFTLKEIVKKYSDFIEYPIILMKEDNKSEILNSRIPLWRKNKTDITSKDYNEFYKHIAHDLEDPMDVIHFKAEGLTEFTALLYIPTYTPFNIYTKDFTYGPALYIKNILIIEHSEELLPPYLRFIKGIVDAADLPLNISREFLQDNRQISIIRNNLVKKILEQLEYLKKNNREKYIKIYETFGKILKEGLNYDITRKQELASLLVANTTKTGEGEYKSLDEYVANMKADQEYIYYIPASNIPDVLTSPYLDFFKDRDIEVLILKDDFDDIIMESLSVYKDKKVKSILSSEIDTSVQDVQVNDIILLKILDIFKDTLNDKIEQIKHTNRLKNTLSLLLNQSGLSTKSENALKSFGNSLPLKKVLEINVESPIIKLIKERYENNDLSDSELKEYGHLIYEMALICEGEKPENPARFSKVIEKLIEKALTTH
jgi:molecular chaperone HtpG